MPTPAAFLSPPSLVWHGRVPFALAQLPADYAADLTAVALEHEEWVKQLPVTRGWEKVATANPTSARYSSYNAFLLDKRCLPLFFAVRSLYRFLLSATGRANEGRYIQCWYNVHRSGQNFHRHCHETSYIGIFSACAEGSETVFGPFPVSTEHDRGFPHRNGQLLLTEGGTKNYHEVSAWQRDDVPRVTFAFDIVDTADWGQKRKLIPFDGEFADYSAPSSIAGR